MFSDTDIRKAIHNGEIEILPHVDSMIGPASYDMHLLDEVLMPLCVGSDIDLSVDEPPMMRYRLPEYNSREHYYLKSGETLLGSTLELVKLKSRTIACDIAGISSLARAFVMVHVIAGFVDPGWGAADGQNSQLTVELKNVGPWNIRLWHGMRIGQLRFYRTESAVTTMYGERGRRSHYTEGYGPQASQYHRGYVTLGSQRYE